MSPQAALLALSLAIGVACAASRVDADFDRQGRITRCEVAVYEVARVVKAECSETVAKASHQEESGWAGKALSALGGWLAAKVGL